MDKKIVISGLNIVAQPHSPEIYLKLCRALLALKKPISIRGTQYLMIGEMNRLSPDDPLDGLFGRFYRFDQIDPNAPWFNVEDHAKATDDDMAQVSIPAKLKPNLVMFDFVFFPKGHVLYLESKSGQKIISPSSVKKLIDALCSTTGIVKNFGKIETTVVPDKEQLEAILGLHRLAKLAIDVRRPNPDDLGEDEEDKVFGRFDRMGTRRMVEILTSEPGESIKPDEDVKLMARVAARNGKVTAIGFSALGQRVEESTVNRPWRGIIEYDSRHQAASDAMIEGARKEHAAR